MKSAFAEGFEALLDSADEATGRKNYIRIDGRKVRALIQDLSVEEVQLAGGSGDRGGFRAEALQSEFAQPPEQGSDISASEAEQLQVLSYRDVNGATYEILAGNIASED